MAAPPGDAPRRADALRPLSNAVTALVLFALMVVTLVDVVGRYLFNAPIFGSDDLVRFGMGILVFAALPEVCRRREHISVDLLTQGRTRHALRRIEPLLGLLAAAVLAFMAWRLTVVALNAMDYGDRSPLLRIPYAPLGFFLAASAAASAAIEAAIGIRSLLRPAAH